MNATSLPIIIALALWMQDPGLVDPGGGVRPSRVSIAPALNGVTQVVLDVEDLLDALEPPAKEDRMPALGPLSHDQENAERLLQAISNVQDVSRKNKATTTLADILKRWMTPAFAPETDRLDVVAPGRISLTAGAEKVAWAQKFCEWQRSARDYVEVEARVFYMPKGTLHALGIEGPTRTFDREADLDALLTRLKDRDATSLVNAPRLLIQPRAQASLSTGESVSYVSDWRLEIVEPGPQTIAVPTIGSVFDGTIMECRAVPLKEGLYGLELNFTNSRLVRPIPTKNLRIGSGEGKDVTVGLPEVKKVGIDTRVSLADGASLLFGGISPEEGREVALTVTLKRARLDSQPR